MYYRIVHCAHGWLLRKSVHLQYCEMLNADTDPILFRLIGELSTIIATKERSTIRTSQVQDILEQLISYKNHNPSCCELSRDREQTVNDLQNIIPELCKLYMLFTVLGNY